MGRRYTTGMLWPRIMLPVCLLLLGCGDAAAPAGDAPAKVTVVAARLGEVAQLGMVNGKVELPDDGGSAEPGRSRVRLGLSEPEFYRLFGAGAADGAPVRVFLSDDGEAVASGRVLTVARGVDASTGVVQMRATVSGGDGVLTPGRQVRVQVEGRRVRAFTIPAGAMVETTRSRWLFVCVDGKAQPRNVALGDVGAGSQVILGGLAEGEWVIVDPPPRLREGMAVEAIRDDAEAR